MKRYIFKFKRCNSNKKTIIYKRNYRLLKSLSEYKKFLINSHSVVRNKNGEYDANLILENIRKNTEMLNKVLLEGDKMYNTNDIN